MAKKKDDKGRVLLKRKQYTLAEWEKLTAKQQHEIIARELGLIKD
jgi:hypothetical protein